jgi:dipeptidyl aminopeptidase/acylaminoacyl peptidase
MPRLLAPEDLYALTLVEGPRIAPDGTRIAYVQTSIDRESYEYRRSIWVAPFEGGKPRQFTAGPKDSAPRWSPDGRMLAFLRAPGGEVKPADKAERDKGKGKPQIWVIATEGGEARQVTFLRNGAGAPEWSPDGATLLFSTQVGGEDDQEAVDAELQGKHVPRVWTIDQLWHRLDSTGFIYEKRSHLYTVPAAGGEPRQLTDGDWNDGDPAWSADGTRIAFVSDRTEDRWRFPAASVWVMDAAGGEPRRLTDEALGCSAPAWSPDGTSIAFLAAPRRRFTGHTDLYVVSVAAGGSDQRSLTEDFIACCDDRCIDDLRDHVGPHLAWAADGSRIFFLATARGTAHVYAAAPQGGGQPGSVTTGNVHVYGFSPDKTGERLALAISDPAVPGDLYSQAGSGEPQRLTAVNEKLLGEVELAGMEEIGFTGANEWALQGWVMRPTRAAPGERVPAVLEIHGGPAYMYGYSFFLEFQLLAAQGYAVVFSNPRGSVGYGRDFTHAIIGDWGGKDYADVMAGLDAALARGGLDETRLGVAGGSYGGYMTNWIVGHTDRFRAAVTMRCVANIATMFGTSDIGWDLAVDELGATPWEDLDKLMRHSPITYVANIHTPLLILHSDNDLRCPIGEGEQMFTALKYLGRETKMVRFEGQSHGLSRGGHPRTRVLRLGEIQSWFGHYLGVAER